MALSTFGKGFNWLIGSPSFGSLYPALHALQSDGWVIVSPVQGADKPVRKIYNIADDKSWAGFGA